MRLVPFLALLAQGCGVADAARLRDVLPSNDRDAATGTEGARPIDGDTAPRRLEPPEVVRALYVNRWAAQSMRRMRRLVAVADSTEINALVLDMKDEFGLNYVSTDASIRRNAGSAGAVPKLAALLDTLRAHGVLPIARIVVFKDSVAARVHPELTIRKQDGSVWRDHQGLAWVDPYNAEVWEYNIRVAEELARLGFREIQYDYIRFPEPYRSLPAQHFPSANGRSKPRALAEFLTAACARIRKLEARCTIDVFGLVTSLGAPLEIGQHWETLSPVVDVLLPMVYPSHYPRGAFGVARPNAEPYRVVYAAIARAHDRDAKLGIRAPEHVRPYLQTFSIGTPSYEASHLRDQKRAVYDAGYDGWVLWNPSSAYDAFLPALERELVTRKKTRTGTQPR